MAFADFYTGHCGINSIVLRGLLWTKQHLLFDKYFLLKRQIPISPRHPLLSASSTLTLPTISLFLRIYAPENSSQSIHFKNDCQISLAVFWHFIYLSKLSFQFLHRRSALFKPNPASTGCTCLQVVTSINLRTNSSLPTWQHRWDSEPSNSDTEIVALQLILGNVSRNASSWAFTSSGRIPKINSFTFIAFFTKN